MCALWAASKRAACFRVCAHVLWARQNSRHHLRPGKPDTETEACCKYMLLGKLYCRCVSGDASKHTCSERHVSANSASNSRPHLKPRNRNTDTVACCTCWRGSAALSVCFARRKQAQRASISHHHLKPCKRNTETVVCCTCRRGKSCAVSVFPRAIGKRTACFCVLRKQPRRMSDREWHMSVMC